MRRKLSLLLGLLLMLPGCSTIAPPPEAKNYFGREPVLDIRRYFKGDVEGWGVFTNRQGMVEQQFHIVRRTTWKGNEGKMADHFVYNNGRKETRLWTVRVDDNHNFIATADDVVGEAIGEQYGNAVNMKYTLSVPVRQTRYDIEMNDWMYRLNEQTVISRTQMRKFSFRSGELIITFNKP